MKKRRIRRQCENRAVPGEQVLNVHGWPHRPGVLVPPNQAHPTHATQVSLREGGGSREFVRRVPVHPHQGRCQAQAVVQPEARARAELDREGLELVGAAAQHARMNVALRVDVPHAALQPGLPRDVRIAQLPRVANVAGAAELGNVQFHIVFAGEPVPAAREPEIASQDRQSFDTVADGVPDAVLLARHRLALSRMGKQAHQDRPHRGAGAQE